ncbi:MAG: hypothetical protein WCK02_17850 [Bacteroidota bacterium]
MKKKCEHCGEEFEAKRNDARFCSSSCKYKYWQKNKESESELKQNSQTNEVPLHSTLKGIIDKNTLENNSTSIPANQHQIIRVEYQTESPIYKEVTSKISPLNDLILKIKTKMQRLTYEINMLIDQYNKTSVGKAIEQGFIIDPTYSTPLKNSIFSLGIYCIDILFNKQSNEEHKSQIERIIKSKKEEFQKLFDLKQTTLRKISNLKIQLLGVNQFETRFKEEKLPQKSIEQSPKIEPVKTIENTSFIPTNNVKPMNENIFVVNNNQSLGEVKSTNKSSSKIISSHQLSTIDYKALNFQGRWSDFIGYPSINFHCAIHGKAGEGKSTFAIQFANYLAESFGLVVYISGEEGFSKTIKDKFVNNGAMSENLYVADLRNYDDIIKEIGINDFHFIVIDSLNNMRIDAEKLKLLRERYKNSALITICQATKDGKMRGSYEIIHDADIEIIVTNGIAETNKNRFKEKHKEFKVF